MTYSASGSKGASFRFLPDNTIFDIGGSCIFLKDNDIDDLYVLALMNSKFAFYVAICLNPTVNIQVGDLKRVPVEKPKQFHKKTIVDLSKSNINLTISIDSFSILEDFFKESPLKLNTAASDMRKQLFAHLNYENNLRSQILINEAMIDKIIFEVYDLTEQDKGMVLVKEGQSIGSLPVLYEARKAYLLETEEIQEFPLDNIRAFIESLPVKEFAEEEREKVESGFPTLYQSNNDLEEFCIRHQINPINVWYWFKQSDVIPNQRMQTLAMEFLADMIREILMEDEDGIVSLMPNSGGKQILDLIEAKFYEKGFSSAQYSSFDSVLGRPLNDYINKYFFAELSDHLNLFMYMPKTPFIWHLTSGSEQGFDCYIIIYKWSCDNLMRLRSVYIENRERALQNRQSDLADNESASAQNEKDRIFKQLKEIEVFKGKIDELLKEGYNPILDDGVGKNIAPLQQKKMLAYDVLNTGQLKKYLNADW